VKHCNYIQTLDDTIDDDEDGGDINADGSSDDSLISIVQTR